MTEQGGDGGLRTQPRGDRERLQELEETVEGLQWMVVKLLSERILYRRLLTARIKESEARADQHEAMAEAMRRAVSDDIPVPGADIPDLGIIPDPDNPEADVPDPRRPHEE